MVDSMKAEGEAMDEIQILSGQTSDANLAAMILDIKNQRIELEPIVRRYSKWLVNVDLNKDIDWNALLRQYNSTISNQLSRLIPINKRIEELLCGEEDT